MPRAGKVVAVKPAAAGKKGKGPKAHKLPDPLPEGEILKDIRKRQWKIGKAIGEGGFGLIYTASALDSSAASNYVVKVEPSTNGPLFSELSFYQRVAKPCQIQDFKRAKKLQSFGMPCFVASGQHDSGGTRYRFMVMDRFGTDLQKLFEQCGKKFPVKTVFTLAIQMLYVLEFIHENSYVHADIKGANMLLGLGKTVENQAYLVDYGLAYKYLSDGKHKEYKEDPKRCHDGTIEFTSIDAHKGASPARRGDLEILGYCIVQWLCGQLPWEDNLDNLNYIRNQKIKYMGNTSDFMKSCRLQSFPEVEGYLKYVKNMEYETSPDYKECRKFFKDGLKKRGLTEGGKLQFSTTKPSGPKKKSNARKRKSDLSEEISSQDEQTDSGESSPPKKIKQSRQAAQPNKRATKTSAKDRLKSPPVRGSPIPEVTKPAVEKVKSPPVRGSPRTKADKSTVNRRDKKFPAGSAARSPPIPGISPGYSKRMKQATSPAVTVGRSTTPNGVGRTKKKKPTRPKVNVAVQTSPGLKGLKYRRNMTST